VEYGKVLNILSTEDHVLWITRFGISDQETVWKEIESWATAGFDNTTLDDIDNHLNAVYASKIAEKSQSSLTSIIRTISKSTMGVVTGTENSRSHGENHKEDAGLLVLKILRILDKEHGYILSAELVGPKVLQFLELNVADELLASRIKSCIDWRIADIENSISTVIPNNGRYAKKLIPGCLIRSWSFLISFGVNSLILSRLYHSLTITLYALIR
jgi:hypothetical protein